VTVCLCLWSSVFISILDVVRSVFELDQHQSCLTLTSLCDNGLVYGTVYLLSVGGTAVESSLSPATQSKSSCLPNLPFVDIGRKSICWLVLFVYYWSADTSLPIKQRVFALQNREKIFVSFILFLPTCFHVWFISTGHFGLHICLCYGFCYLLGSRGLVLWHIETWFPRSSRWHDDDLHLSLNTLSNLGSLQFVLFSQISETLDSFLQSHPAVRLTCFPVCGRNLDHSVSTMCVHDVNLTTCVPFPRCRVMFCLAPESRVMFCLAWKQTRLHVLWTDAFCRHILSLSIEIWFWIFGYLGLFSPIFRC
jgi:hypothetical protein